jgi:hypothetical protein
MPTKHSATMVDTIKFNVGGRPFEVSRVLIDHKPDTLLAKMISETWEKDPEKPLFIDRDGDLFAYVLNYLRYGSIELPNTIPQSMFKRELDYFGITPEESSVKQMSIGEIARTFKTEFQCQKLKYETFTLATECQLQFCQGSCEKDTVCFTKNINSLDFVTNGEFSKAAKEMLEKHLRHYFGMTANQ